MSGMGAWAALRDAPAALVPHARVHRRDVRGEPWAVLHNALSGEQVRLNAAALEVVLALDGCRSIENVLETVRPAADEALREALARTLLTLETSGLIRLGRVADTGRLVARAERPHRAAPDPLALRLPLLDPDAPLERLAPHLRWLSARRAGMLLGALLALALLTAIGAAERIGAELSQVAETPARWWLYVLLWPVLKLVHELAHALVVKHHGGAVHEAGVTLLVLMPVPYVDASDSARFERRGARLAVAAAGMLAELALAALALLLWHVTEPGPIHDVAFAAALLGSVSTVFFNANPLLRFDGYQLLQDTLDMPNLGSRSSAYLSWLLRRHALGARVERAPVTGPRERRWLLGYGLASLIYRWVLTFSIALYLAAAIPLVGVPLALFALYRLALRPALRGVRYVAGSAELAGRRRGAVLGTLACAVTFALAVAVLPLPSSTRIEGVVRASAKATLHAAAGGEVIEVRVSPGARVHAGQVVLRLAAPELEARRRVLEAELAVLVTRRQALLGREPVDAARLALDIERARRERAALDEDIAALEVRADSDGRFAPVGGRIARGQAVRRGEVLGHVVAAGELGIEAVVDQRRIGRVRAGVRAVRVRLAERLGETLEATLVGETPAGSRRLPSAALAFDGSGGIPVASAEGELRTLEPVFQVELALPDGLSLSGTGGRAYVTLVHDPESLGRRWWRAARQLFLEKLSV